MAYLDVTDMCYFNLFVQICTLSHMYTLITVKCWRTTSNVVDSGAIQIFYLLLLLLLLLKAFKTFHYVNTSPRVKTTHHNGKHFTTVKNIPST